MIAELKVGPQTAADSTQVTSRGGRGGESIIQQLHGRLYEQCYRGNLYGIGCNLTALSAATILLTASGQPILGVYNPPTSTVNLVLIRAALTVQVNNVTSVAPGAFIWAASNGNSALSAGLAPFNRKTLTNAGSQGKAFSLSTASLLTGLTNNLTFFGGEDIAVPSTLATTAFPATAIAPATGGVHDFDGGLIVPPGAVVGLFNTVSTTTHSVAGRLIWEEVPVV